MRFQFLAGEIVAVQPVAGEGGDDPLAVGHRRRGAIRVRAVRGLLLLRGDAHLPEQLAVGAVEAHERAALAHGLRDEDAVAPDDGRGIAGLWQRDAPADVLVLAPLHGEVLLGGDAVGVRAAPGGPVGGGSAEGNEECGGEE